MDIDNNPGKFKVAGGLQMVYRIFFLFSVILPFLWVSPALSCGEPQEPNGCSSDFYYSLKTYPETCSMFWNKRESKYYNPWVPLPEGECKKEDSSLPDSYEEEKIREAQFFEKLGRYLTYYPMRALFDGSLQTPWVEAVPGPGSGIVWQIGSKQRTLTFLGMKIVNGCARDPAMFENNNRLKTATVFSDENPPQTLLLKDTPEWQTILFKQPIVGYSISIKLQEVYKGEKYDDTCLSELVFLTKEKGEWPQRRPENLFETHPVLARKGQRLDGTEYTYPSYDFYRQNKKTGTVDGHSLYFQISPTGWVFIIDNSEKALIHASKINGEIRLDQHPAFEAKDALATISHQEENFKVLGWIDNQKICFLQATSDPSQATLFIYQVSGKKLKQLVKKQPGSKQLQEASVWHKDFDGSPHVDWYLAEPLCR